MPVGDAPTPVADQAPLLGSPPKVWATARGTFEGRIGLPGEVPRGSNGFGYDPLFLVAPDFTHTSAELTPADKNRLSHRGRAAGGMLVQLHHLLTGD
jgi:XTP/dITP diphosphohydrolase